MGRPRSPLENAVYAFIALWLFARLAGVLFTLSAAGGHGPSALALWTDASTAVPYALIGVEPLILILLVATERYWLAPGAALLMGARLCARSRGGGCGGRNVEPDRVAIGGAVVLPDDRRAGSSLASDGVRIPLSRNDARPRMLSWLVTRLEGGPFAGR